MPLYEPIYYYTGIGSLAPFVYTRRELLALIRFINEDFNNPIPPGNLQDDQLIIDYVGAVRLQ